MAQGASYWRKILLWLFAAGESNPQFGTKEAFSTLTWLFGIIIGQAVAFAASVQKEGRPIIAIVGYAGIVVLTLIGTALLLNSSEPASTGRQQFAFDRTSIRFGRWLQITAILFACAFIAASYWGWLPGQTGARHIYRRPDVQTEVLVATQGDGFLDTKLNRQTDARSLVDKYTMDRWRRWFQNDRWNGADSNQILLIRQKIPFDKPYRSFWVAIDIYPQEGGEVEFVDGFVLLGRDLEADESYDPLYRIINETAGASVSIPLPGGMSASAPAREYQQVRLPWIEGGSRLLPAIHVANPNEGDSLLLFVKVRERADQPIKDKPPSWFNVQLRVL